MTSTPPEFSELLKMDPAAQRRAIRDGRYAGHTAGLARGNLQCNLAILPVEHAPDFGDFCRLNPKACPLAGISEAGSFSIPRLGASVDVRRDAPLYNIYRHGVLDEQVRDLEAIWGDDLVAFAIGCSFTFENALSKAGIEMRHIDLDRTVPMFKSNIETAKSGAFFGPMVVSMRPIRQDRLKEVYEICQKYPLAHGTPVHSGDPADIGIADINCPDWGDQTVLKDGEVPVFWACGVTPQAAIMTAKLPLAIAHAPGAMLITDTGENTPPLFPSNDNKMKN